MYSPQNQNRNKYQIILTIFYFNFIFLHFNTTHPFLTPFHLANVTNQLQKKSHLNFSIEMRLKLIMF